MKNLLKLMGIGNPDAQEKMEPVLRSFTETLIEMSLTMGAAFMLGEKERSYCGSEAQIIGSVHDNIRNVSGQSAVWDFLILWASEFQTKNQDRQWDGEFYDEVDAFLLEKCKEYIKGI